MVDDIFRGNGLWTHWPESTCTSCMIACSHRLEGQITAHNDKDHRLVLRLAFETYRLVDCCVKRIAWPAYILNIFDQFYLAVLIFVNNAIYTCRYGMNNQVFCQGPDCI